MGNGKEGQTFFFLLWNSNSRNSQIYIYGLNRPIAKKRELFAKKVFGYFWPLSLSLTLPHYSIATNFNRFCQYDFSGLPNFIPSSSSSSIFNFRYPSSDYKLLGCYNIWIKRHSKQNTKQKRDRKKNHTQKWSYNENRSIQFSFACLKVNVYSV